MGGHAHKATELVQLAHSVPAQHVAVNRRGEVAPHDRSQIPLLRRFSIIPRDIMHPLK